jgi:hypothetical protein
MTFRLLNAQADSLCFLISNMLSLLPACTQEVKGVNCFEK